MLDLNIIKNSWLFKVRSLCKNEKLFSEWDEDNNIYIIESGSLTVEKKLHNNSIKELATLQSWEIFGEWALNNSEPKQVQIKAKTNTVLLQIDSQTGITQYIEKFPKAWLDLFKNIIDISNKRLLISNALITANYEMNQYISWLEKINIKSILKIIDKFKIIAKVDYILYIENNPVFKEYLTLQYDTRKPWKITDTLLEWNSQQELFNALWEIKMSVEKYNHMIKLNIADMDIWYLILGKKESDFSHDEIKIIDSVSNSFAWVIRQKKILEEQRNKVFMRE